MMSFKCATDLPLLSW